MTGHAAQDQHGAVQHAQGPLHLDGEARRHVAEEREYHVPKASSG